MAFPWPLDGTIRLHYVASDFAKKNCVSVRECFFKNQFTECHYKLGLVCFLPHFYCEFNYFSKERNYSVTHDGVESFLFLKECFYALAFSQDMYQVLHHQDSAKTFYI